MQKYFNKITNYPGIYYIQSQNKTFNKKPDRSYYITYTNQYGKFIREKIGWASEGYTQQIAIHVRGERLRKIRHGKDIPEKNKKELSFEQAWTLYDKWLDTGKKHPYDDRNRYKNYIKNKIASKALSQITTDDIEQFKATLIEKKLAPQTVKHIIIIIRQVYNKMITRGLYDGHSPTRGIKFPRIDNKRARFLTTEESQNLLTEIKNRSQQLYEISLLSLHTGMRASEVFGLLWGHIDFDNNIIHVADTKGGPARDVFLTNKIKEMLRAKKKGKRGDLVFISRTGKQIGDVSKAFLRSVREIGLNDGIKDRRQIVSFHTLRHTFASWLALQSTPILEIKELLGHATLAMTERYAHLIPDKKRESVEKMERAFLEEVEDD